MDLDFDKIYKKTTTALHWLQLHPCMKRDIKSYLQSFIMHGIFTLVFVVMIYNIIYHDLKANNFSQTCKNGVLCIVYITLTFQYCVLIFHKKTILKLINLVKEDYNMAHHMTSEEKKIVEDYANSGTYTAKQWMVMGCIASSSFVIKSIVLMVYYYYKNEFRLVSYYDLVYPTIIENNKENIFLYLVLYVFLMQCGIYAAIMYVAYIPLGPMFMLHASGQLSIVKKRIDNLFTDLNQDVIKIKLTAIIKQLQYIYSFVNLIQDVFKIAYELSLKSTAVMLPVAVYEVIETLHAGEISLEFITFVIGAVLYSSSPCYYSQLLLDKGEEVRQSIYFCGWEQHYDRRTSTTLQILLMNALRPVAIRAVFRTLCLETLMELFQQSYTIFSLMNAMWE